MDKSRYGSDEIPLVNEKTAKYRLSIEFSKIAWFTVSLPFFGFMFCVVWSILYNFDDANFTHCEVYNFLPSISAAIGSYKPQKDVWRTAIAIQAVTRLLVFIMYYRYYEETLYRWAQWISNIALITYAIENIALVTLSFWSSNENYEFHKLSFITFLIMSILHMSFSCISMTSHQIKAQNAVKISSLRWKRRMLFLNLTSILMACYFFYRHNTYCESGVYSLFALAEYMVVITNMGFHMTAAWDFAGRSLLLSSNGIRIISYSQF